MVENEVRKIHNQPSSKLKIPKNRWYYVDQENGSLEAFEISINFLISRKDAALLNP